MLGEPSGVELAAERAVNYPDNKVTLVHDRPRLLESVGQKAGGKALLWLRSKNVEVYLEQSIDLESMSEGDRLYRTSSGIEITADCYFSCLDRPLSSSWIRGSELEDCLDNDGRLMVDANLRVKGQVNIFAAGDIIDIPVCSYCTSISAVEVPVDAFISFTNFHYLTEGWFIQYLLVDILLHMWF